MNIHEAQMFVNLIAASKAQGLVRGDDDDFIVERLKAISIERHCSNGYFSFDGILDDLTELLGDVDLAADILNEC